MAEPKPVGSATRDASEVRANFRCPLHAYSSAPVRGQVRESGATRRSPAKIGNGRFNDPDDGQRCVRLQRQDHYTIPVPLSVEINKLMLTGNTPPYGARMSTCGGSDVIDGEGTRRSLSGDEWNVDTA
ncbi:hypothetical protein OG981_53680 [Streptomyces mirabilis]|uniref:hypothetical protein n=1 Tax=Streptomyces mirabilis TaxID=68239 RepID=UPI002E1C9652